MEWWRNVLIGLAAVGVTTAVIGVICKKAFALGWATAGIICSKVSTPVATFFGKRWLEPFFRNFLDGYRARIAAQPGIVPEPEGETHSGLTGQEQRRRLWDRRGVRRKP